MLPVETADRRVFTSRVLRALLLTLLVAATVFLLGWAYDVVLTIFAGAVLGVFLNGLAAAISRRSRFTYRSALGAVVVCLLVLVALSIWFVGPALVNQVDQLVMRIPAALALLAARTSGIPFVHTLADRVPQFGPVAGAAVNVMRVGFEAVAGVVVALVVGIYGAVDPGAYLRGLLRVVPPTRRERARQVIGRTTSALLRWLVGQFVLMVIVGTVTSVGLWIAGVPLSFALGLLAGVMTYVPYLGVILSMVPALLVALSVSPLKMLWVVVVFAVAHGLEGYVLSPLIAERTVKFPPAFTIAVQILLGAIWGVLGFAFATPIAVVATMLVQTLYVEDVLGDVPVSARGVEH
ncbi:MAG TPA: AI-2E family transporter [Polyangiaceae bacterium]|nr:AI-2E family transporter [Polyangiaceae bacterium]